MIYRIVDIQSVVERAERRVRVPARQTGRAGLRANPPVLPSIQPFFFLFGKGQAS